MKADLPELVGPCNIDVWNESNLTGEDFNSKYAYIYAYRCTYIQDNSCNSTLKVHTSTLCMTLLLCSCRYGSSLPVVVRLEHSQEVCVC